MDRPCHPHCAALFFLSLLVAGCSDSRVDAYRVPKEKDAGLPVTAVASDPASAQASNPVAAPTAPGGNLGAAPVSATDSGLTWSAPANWQPKPLGAMRKGSYVITGDAGATADVSITAFPGAVGGEFANVNRWRGQVALPPIVESDLAASVTHLNQNGLIFTLVDLISADAANPRQILGAMTPCEGAMWFFKLSGPAALVATTKPAFIEFLKTVKVAAPATP